MSTKRYEVACHWCGDTLTIAVNSALHAEGIHYHAACRREYKARVKDFNDALSRRYEVRVKPYVSVK